MSLDAARTSACATLVAKKHYGIGRGESAIMVAECEACESNSTEKPTAAKLLF
jgi:hypothetical protein